MMNLKEISEFYEKYSKLNFIDKPPNLICELCNEIYKYPHQTPCGCRFCLKCFEEKLENESRKCPGNSVECTTISMSDITFDAAVNKDVMKLKVYCPHGFCKIIKTLKEIIDHVDECKYRMILCSKCNIKYQVNIIKNHEVNECPQREYKCTYCFKTMAHEYYTSEHLNPDSDDLCDKYSVKECPNKCNSKEFIGNLREHLKICSNAKQKCPLSTSNCSKTKFTDGELKKHFDENLIHHNKYLNEKIDKLESENLILNNKIKQLESTNESNDEKIKKLESLCANLAEQMKGIDSKSISSASSIEKQIVNQSGTFIWKFTNFEAKKRDAESGGPVSITSDPFYTSEFGYKMCLKLYPAGDGIGRSTHLSVFFALMKGDYDDILSWPFKHKVTLTLLDQAGNGKNYTETFRPDEKSICYEKPRDNMNVASGAPKFYELNELKKSSFYKNNNIFLKITIVS